MAKQSNMDRIIAWPSISIRIFGDQSGAYVDAGKAFVGKLDRRDAARLIWELRKRLRAMRGAEITKGRK